MLLHQIVLEKNARSHFLDTFSVFPRLCSVIHASKHELSEIYYIQSTLIAKRRVTTTAHVVEILTASRQSAKASSRPGPSSAVISDVLSPIYSHILPPPPPLGSYISFSYLLPLATRPYNRLDTLVCRTRSFRSMLVFTCNACVFAFLSTRKELVHVR